MFAISVSFSNTIFNYLENKEPTLGSIEHAEWQQKMDEISRLAEIMISKQRHGPIGSLQLRFDSKLTKFSNLADEKQQTSKV